MSINRKRIVTKSTNRDDIAIVFLIAGITGVISSINRYLTFKFENPIDFDFSTSVTPVI